jgi:hypothetical protein
MNAPLRSFLQIQVRRRIAWAMAAAILFAGIAQAAHFHKDELIRPGSTDVHCLLCLYAGGSATPPAVVPLVPRVGPRLRDYRAPDCLACPESADTASYDARGPPAA